MHASICSRVALESEGISLDPAKLDGFTWCYRDEDFGGSVARQSRMKGRWRHIVVLDFSRGIPSLKFLTRDSLVSVYWWDMGVWDEWRLRHGPMKAAHAAKDANLMSLPA